MKLACKLFRNLVILAGSFLFPAGSIAATHPLKAPLGIALDSKGNLYVANQGANQILVYDPSYAQIRTITAGVSEPTAVAVDIYNNLYVANAGSGSITEYSPNGVQNTAGTLGNVVRNPNSLAVDGIGDLWVQMSGSELEIFNMPNYIVREIERQFSGNPSINGVAACGPYYAVGMTGVTRFGLTSFVLSDNAFVGGFVASDDGVALAFDAKCNLYVANSDGSIDAVNMANDTQTLIVQFSFAPSGIAVDTACDRMYIADRSYNFVAVYDLQGNFLHLIQ